MPMPFSPAGQSLGLGAPVPGLGLRWLATAETDGGAAQAAGCCSSSSVLLTRMPVAGHVEFVWWRIGGIGGTGRLF